MSHVYALEATRAVKAGNRTITSIGTDSGWHIASIGVKQALTDGHITFTPDGYLKAVDQ